VFLLFRPQGLFGERIIERVWRRREGPICNVSSEGALLAPSEASPSMARAKPAHGAARRSAHL